MATYEPVSPMAASEGAGSVSVLVVDDDTRMQALLEAQLSARGYGVRIAGDGPGAVAGIAENEPDVVLLDIEMPGMSGLDVCRKVREWSQVPIILVTATDQTATKVAALQMGADDYLTKPYQIDELTARIQAILRRAAGKESAPPVVRIGSLTVDRARREVCRDGVPIHLTKTEFDLLAEMAKNPDRVLTYEHLLRAVWGPGYDDIRPLHVHICKLRRKMEPPDHPSHIVAIPGVGYRLDLGD